MRILPFALICALISGCGVSSSARFADPDAPIRTCGNMIQEAVYQLNSVGMPDSAIGCYPPAYNGKPVRSLSKITEERLASLEAEIKQINQSWETE